MGKKKPPSEPPYVDKASALRILRDAGAISVREFGVLLADAGFRVPGPRKAWNILDRLRAQGLVSRTRGQAQTSYTLPTGAGDRHVTRRANRVDWEITNRGLLRLEWLQKRRKRR